jgi:hypothetical protein
MRNSALMRTKNTPRSAIELDAYFPNGVETDRLNEGFGQLTACFSGKCASPVSA